MRLTDGRPVVREVALIDSYPALYFYFDRSGLETATPSELEGLLAPLIGGIEERIAFEANAVVDTQGRSIWEVQIVTSPVD